MFGLPAWLIAVLLKLVAPLIITELRRLGLVDAAEAFGLKTGLKVLSYAREIKTYPAGNPESQKNEPFKDM